MRRATILALAALTLAAAACGRVVVPEDRPWAAYYGPHLAVPDYRDGRVTAESNFRAMLVDRRLEATRTGVFNPVWFTARSDNTVTGWVPNVGEVTGTWHWRGAHWCRTLFVGLEPLPGSPDCQEVTMTTHGPVFTSDEGLGSAVLYRQGTNVGNQILWWQR